MSHISQRQCHYTKPGGSPCRAYARQGSGFCFFHDPNSTAERHEARTNGGRERSRKAAVLPANTPDKALTSAAEVTGLLAETINQVRRGEIDPRVSNAIGYLAGVLLKAKDWDELEQRLARVESIIHDQAKQAVTAEVFEFVNPKTGGQA
jgi:hypothetical protein